MMANLTTIEFWCSYLLHSFTCLSDNAQVCGAPGLQAALSPDHVSSVRTLCTGRSPVQEDFIQTTGNLSTTDPVTTNVLSSNLSSITSPLPVPPASNANIGSHGICTTAGRILTWSAAVLALAFIVVLRSE
ncbi:uncharacterized protein LOC112560109 isoform X2 [Pomacea canaliculata]|nr:uncharacterized protein LOC112560109 isoform X2 [Pomacea canaliculata]